MPRISPISWRKFENFLLYIGCKFERQRGDHRVYWRAGMKRPVIVPMYKDLPVFIIRSNLHTLGINPDEYLEILKKVR